SVETHVEVCADCQTRLESMVTATQRSVSAAVAPGSESIAEPAEDFLSRLRQLSPAVTQTHAAKDLREGMKREVSQFRSSFFNRPDSYLGRRLGKYEILDKLGKGGMGAVFKARHTELGKLVALKMLTDDEPNEVAVARFKNEMRAVGKLDHPNIVVAH